MENSIKLKCVEQTFDMEYKGKSYQVKKISDWESGEFEIIISTSDGQFVPDTEKNEVLDAFYEWNCDSDIEWNDEDDENNEL